MSEWVSATTVDERRSLRVKRLGLPKSVRGLSTRALTPIARFALRHWIRHDELVRVRQQIRYLALGQLLARSPEQPVDLTLFELSVFSQNGEDGVVQEILRRIGVSRRFFVELGCSSNESNCLLLADAFGWSGLFIDANETEFHALSRKYRAASGIRVVQDVVTADNFQDILRREEVPNEFDLLSIDVDGNDYWIWQALEDYRPRMVVIEYNASLPHDRSLVQPNDSGISWDGTESFGASAGALRDLARQKNYRLVHTDLSGTNAFFVREDLADSALAIDSEAQVRAPNYFLYGLTHRLPVATSPGLVALPEPSDGGVGASRPSPIGG